MVPVESSFRLSMDREEIRADSRGFSKKLRLHDNGSVGHEIDRGSESDLPHTETSECSIKQDQLQG